MIFPIPKSHITKDGSYTFRSQLPLDDLYGFYSRCIGCDEITFNDNNALGNEAYVLKIDTDGVSIESSSDEGTFRALTSLYQLAVKGNGAVSCAEILDNPDFERRGYMLDISRCRMPKPDTIKQLVDILALLKYNEFQLYIDSFCFDYPLIPHVTEGFECLTPNDIKDIEKYCNDRFIDLVPNQNCFGHMEDWLGRDEYKHLEVGYPEAQTGTINPLLDESNELVDKIFDSLLPSFKSEFVNIGLDEAVGLGRYQLEEYCNEHGRDTLFMENLNRIASRIRAKHGKRVQFWADMITAYPDSFKDFPEGAVALEWGYELKNERQMEKHCKDLRDKNVDFYVCPSCNTHYSITGRHEVTTINLRYAAELGRDFGAKGYLVTDWSCPGEGHPHFGVYSFLPVAVGGQYAWNVEEEQKELIMETCFDRYAMDFLDCFVFGGASVGKWLYRMANYFLLEPERVRLGTICGLILRYSMEETKCGGYFDLVNFDDYCFSNVVRYTEDIIANVEKLDMDSQYKREMIVNAKTVIFSAIHCKLRINKNLSDSDIEYLISLEKEIREEFTELWNMRNYEKGIECFLGVLSERMAEVHSVAARGGKG